MATNEGVPPASRTRDRDIAELGQRYREHEQDTDRCNGKSTATEGRRATLSEELVREAHHSEGFRVRLLHGWRCRSNARGCGIVPQMTKGTLWATEAWTGGRHDADDMYVELDYELAVALANVTEGAHGPQY